MQISDNLRKIIVDEFEYVVGKMRAEKDLSRKLYFFSATYGVIHRILNLEYDPTLNLSYMVLNQTYNNINGRFIALGHGEEIAIAMPSNLFEKLEETTAELGKAIDKNTSPLEALEKLAVLAYSTTGNGYYLYQKGLLKI